MDELDANTTTSSSGHTVQFDTVFGMELDWLTPWRKAHGREVATQGEAGATMPLAGIALSGGGIRSASFALGALQALDAKLAATVKRNSPPAGESQTPTSDFKALDIEYSALGRFDYLSTVSGGGYIGTAMIQGMQNSGGAFLLQDLNDREDTAAVRHIRDHSRYLMPHGWIDLLSSSVVILRGIFVNIVLVASVVALAALLWLAAAFGLNRFAADLMNWLASQLWLGPLPVSLLSALVFVLLGYGWGILRSGGKKPGTEFGTWINRLATWLLVLWLAVLVIEIQPCALGALAAWKAQPQEAGGYFATLKQNFEWILGVLGVLGTLFSSFLTDRIAADERDASRIAMVRRVSARVALWVVSIILPALIWLAFLHAVLELQTLTLDQKSLIGIGALILLVSGILLDPNANSLFQLYRERLEVAFLHAVDAEEIRKVNPGLKLKHKTGPLATAARLPNPKASPLHIANAALNIQGSPEVNKRGRDADLYSFSPVAHGSASTGFRLADPTSPVLEPAAIMAISGAAASSNMGSQTIRGLALTLALLNVRLGYWLPNPRVPSSGRFDRLWKRLYLIQEMFSQLDEKSPEIYLTDGGHIENLGLYELLRRRCELIVVVDAEADPSLSFASFIALQRYARLDLGIRIELPWQEIRSSHRAVEPILNRGELPAKAMKVAGTHIAVGEIEYPGGKGRLVYVKASMTG
ncbi:MAG: patatin-like phospholipase family protein, partial [Sphingomonadales bacterium]|nr:patatin-like phospholipase family protein [Sphingomonadales bacterium]